MDLRRWWSPYDGCVDRLDGNELRGWAWNRRRPDRAVTLDLFARDIFLGQVTTGFHRPDLASLGMGDGWHGFHAHLPRDADARAQADLRAEVAAARGVTLNGAGAAASLRPRGLIEGIRAFFGPLLRHLASTEPLAADVPAWDEVGHRRVLDRLFVTAPDQGVPHSAFTRHLAVKFGIDTGCATRDGEDAIATWLLDPYGAARGPVRLPLGAEERAFWLGARDASGVIRAQALGGARAGAAPSGRGAVADAYDWAIEQSRRLWVEDCLVGEAATMLLRDTAGARDGQAFPLSAFMLAFRRRNALVARAPVHGVADRQLLYAVIMLYALRAPHLLAYMPTRWLAAMLGDADGPSPFASCLARIFPGEDMMAPGAYARYPRRLGFDVRAQAWPGLRYNAHRCGHGIRRIGQTRHDVQLIGPFRGALGLAESCRRLAGLLMTLDYSLNLVDYDLGQARAEGSAGADTFSLGPIGPARINILHLNLEEIPEAMAFLPDVFSSGYTVAMPYWELSALSACHRLGLSMADEIWAASSFLYTLYRATGTPTHFIGMSRSPTPMAGSRALGRAFLAARGFKPDDFVFLAVADALSWAQRKNTLGIVEAFTGAFPHDPTVRLVIKTHNTARVGATLQTAFWLRVAEACARDPRITILDETLDSPSRDLLLRGCDALVSLHRAEGLGLDVIEALGAGIPVIATAYSGTTDACAPTNSWLVDYDLVPVPPTDYAFVESGQAWAEPRGDAAQLQMRRLREDKVEREARARIGIADIGRRFACEAIARRVDARLASLFETRARGDAPG